MSMNCYFTVAYGVAGIGAPPAGLREALGDDCEVDLGNNVRGFSGYDENTGQTTWSVQLMGDTRISCDYRGSSYGRPDPGPFTPILMPAYAEQDAVTKTLDRLDIAQTPSWLFLVEVN